MARNKLDRNDLPMPHQMEILGDELFSGKANCNRCHREQLWTGPGWNQHMPGEMKIDGFEARRAPASINAEGKAVHGYRTMNLAGSPAEVDRHNQSFAGN